MSNTTNLIIENQTQIEYQDDIGNKGARAIVYIYAKANENLNLHFRWKNSNGIPKNLAGYKGKMSIRERKDGHIIAATCGTEETDDGTVTCDASGNIKVLLSSEKLQALYKSGTWLYDLIVEAPSGIITRLFQGYFYIDRGVTYMD